MSNGWSRSMLEHFIESNLYSRQGTAVTNFKAVLSRPQSVYAAKPGAGSPVARTSRATDRNNMRCALHAESRVTGHKANFQNVNRER